MVSFVSTQRRGPIGLDLGSRSIKLLQLSADRSRILEMARWDLPAAHDAQPNERRAQVTEALEQLRSGRGFRGREAVLCLGRQHLFVQNIRVPKLSGEELEQAVRAEAEVRAPFPAGEAEIRHLEVGDVQQGDVTKREVILLACHRPVLTDLLTTIEGAGFRPVAVDIEPCALLRCYARQFRRDEDKQQRIMFVHVGASNTVVLIARGADILFVKYVDTSGRQLDESVARHLEIDLTDAAALRRHNGDRRADERDPEVARTVAEATRPAVEQLASELSLCIRYHSVTFRGGPLARVVLGGGEASQSLVDVLSSRLDLRCELGDPLRSFEPLGKPGRIGQWDLVTGLALRPTK